MYCGGIGCCRSPFLEFGGGLSPRSSIQCNLWCKSVASSVNEPGFHRGASKAGRIEAEEEEFQALLERVAEIDGGTSTRSPSHQNFPVQEVCQGLEERVADLDAAGPRGRAGAGVGITRNPNKAFEVEFKFCQSLSRLTDDKRHLDSGT